MRLAETDLGYLEFDGNELFVCSKPGVDDPPKVRLLSDAGTGAVSVNKRRFDGVQLEQVLLIGKAEAALGGGVLDIHLQKDGTADDAGMTRAATLSLANGLELRGVQPSPASSGRFTHEGGQFVTIYQGDGNAVTYATQGSLHEATWRAVWSSFGGKL